MPGTDELEATRQIRAAEATARRTPIVALTANAYAEDREACLAAGMDDFLVKPLDRERLAAMLISFQSVPHWRRDIVIPVSLLDSGLSSHSASKTRGNAV